MKGWQAGLAAALMLAVSAAAQESEEAAPAPEPRFTAFQNVCVDARESFAALEAAAAAEGWRAVEESARPELSRVMAQARSYAAQGMTIRAIRLFSRPIIEEERGYLALSHYDNRGQEVISCSFYAFDAPQTVPGALVREWVGTAADDWREQPNRFVTQLWTNPPSMPGVAVFRHMYLARQEGGAPDAVAGMILSIVATPGGDTAAETPPAE